MLAKKVDVDGLSDRERANTDLVSARYGVQTVPKYEMPQAGMPGWLTRQVISRELQLDGNPLLNLASFVTTYMDESADRLFAETLSKNYIDQDEYPQTQEIHNRCVNMLSRLFNAPESETAVGTGTVGSSEAIHLAGLAFKWKWRERRQKEGKPTDKPNLVVGANVQVCWEKFARYFDVELRCVPVTHERYVLGVPEALELVDENTIGVAAILGSTYTGEYEPVKELNDALVELNEKTGWEVPIHVDGASGGFVAPFLTPELVWDFRLPLVKSINASGHKFGLVYPGIGWVIWRDESELPEGLIFHVNYLGGDQPTFNLNFSKGASQMLAQYFNFLHLGREGYTAIMQTADANASYLAEHLARAGNHIMSTPKTVPLVAWSMPQEDRFTVYDVSDRLRARGWIVPAYTMPDNATDLALLRVVVRDDCTRDLLDLLIADIDRSVAELGQEHGQQSRPASVAKDKKSQGVC
ncbi:glutamate decarboxylase [Myxococcota bacterium]|nr:glutamate decarboxylase [Myxococcota bacterium]